MVTARHPNRPLSAFPLTERDAETQHERGLYTVQRGVWMPIPVDHIARPRVYHNRDLWRQDKQGHVFRPGTRMQAPNTQWQRKTLEFLRDNVHKDIPAFYYRAVLGHDVHVSIRGDLFAKHWHANWANPFNPDKFDLPLDPGGFAAHDCDKPWCPVRDGGLHADIGFIEDCGWVSGAKFTDAFVSEEIDELVSTTGTEFADFDFHEVGTGSTAENNNDTALVTPTGIARATGTPTDSDPIYQNVGTITADATETWAEHGLFNNSAGAALMDRSLTGGQSVASPNQVQYTFQGTFNPEA
ncbi:MAG: hypothetical protein ACSLE3_07170 [Microbacteriaceae bacterium]